MQINIFFFLFCFYRRNVQRITIHKVVVIKFIINSISPRNIARNSLQWLWGNYCFRRMKIYSYIRFYIYIYISQAASLSCCQLYTRTIYNIKLSSGTCSVNGSKKYGCAAICKRVVCSNIMRMIYHDVCRIITIV